jgi:penicillin-binding protein 2
LEKQVRYIPLFALFILIGFIYVARLFYLQVVQKSYANQAQSNAVKRVINYPSRGMIFDRKGKLIVNNEVVYDLYITPKQVTNLDTQLFCKLLSIDTAYFNVKSKEAINHSRFLPSLFLKQIPQSVFANLQEYLFQFSGFYAEARNIRSYPYRSAGHVLGYISEVTPNDIKKSNYYQLGDYIGVSGLELSYEQQIRGTRGVRYIQVDRFNREKGSYQNGELDTIPMAGRDLISTLDIELQTYGEELMKGKVGSIVAIEPATGEILAFVSSPSYDPNLLTGWGRGNNYKKLLDDSIGKPLINRPLAGEYPPGSTFKPLMGLIALQEHLTTTNYGFGCGGGYRLGNHIVGCHGHQYASNLKIATALSCNSYFCQLFKLVIQNDSSRSIPEAYENWKAHLNEWGMGVKTGIDLKNESDGNVPSSKYYDKMIGEGEWKGTTIISLGIGQGEMLATPLQMANLVGGIANNGYWITPHLVKAVINDSLALKEKLFKHVTRITDTLYFNSLKVGMEGALKYGTAKRVARADSITMAGKTGTAQNPHGEDHSWFVAYAPKDNPKIAIAVVVENSGFGAKWAAPIASLMIEKYIRGYIKGKVRIALESKMKKGRILKLY